MTWLLMLLSQPQAWYLPILHGIWFLFRGSAYLESTFWDYYHLIAMLLRSCTNMWEVLAKIDKNSHHFHCFQCIVAPNKMADILKTTFSNAFSCEKSFIFLFRFHWSFFARVQSTLLWQHWLRLQGSFWVWAGPLTEVTLPLTGWAHIQDDSWQTLESTYDKLFSLFFFFRWYG